MATFVVAHGAWSAGWAWKKMRPLMRAAGHELWTPTYTGLGERAHLGHADVSLDTHIQDIVAVLETEDLADVILIGHSYGGMVATGVADRARDRVAKLVYLDAFAPADGQAIFDLVPPDIAARMRAGAAASDSGFGIPVESDAVGYRAGGSGLGGAAPKAAAGAGLRHEAEIVGRARNAALSTSMRRRPASATTSASSISARQREGWKTYEVDASHNPHITNPQALLAILNEIAST